MKYTYLVIIRPFPFVEGAPDPVRILLIKARTKDHAFKLAVGEMRDNGDMRQIRSYEVINFRVNKDLLFIGEY